MVVRRPFANHDLIGRALHVSDIFDEIKTAFVKARLTQQSVDRGVRASRLFHATIPARNRQLRWVGCGRPPRCERQAFVHG